MAEPHGSSGAPWWTLALPLLAWALLAVVQPSSGGGWGALLLFAALIALGPLVREDARATVRDRLGGTLAERTA